MASSVPSSNSHPILWGTLIAAVSGGAIIGAVALYRYLSRHKRSVADSRLRRRVLSLLPEVKLDPQGRVEKVQAARIAAYAMMYSRESSETALASAREERLAFVSSRQNEAYSRVVLRTVDLEHRKYNEALHKTAGILGVPLSLLVATTEHYMVSRDQEFASLVADLTTRSDEKRRGCGLSASETTKVWESMSMAAKEASGNGELKAAAETVARGSSAGPVANFVSVVIKTRVYDMMYARYKLTEEEIQDAFQYHNVLSLHI